MPHPDVHIEGVPDEEEQARPREEVAKKVREQLDAEKNKKRIQ
jgi:hypothetical protein